MFAYHTLLLLSGISIDECEENDIVTVAKKILSNEDREKLQIRVAQIAILRDWKRVGQLLGLGSVVEEIEYNNRDRMSSCVLEMLNKWLRKDTSFSTYEEGLLKLSTTLDMVGENALANQLKQECGKWNNLHSVCEYMMILIMNTTFSSAVVSTYKRYVTESLLCFLV